MAATAPEMTFCQAAVLHQPRRSPMVLIRKMSPNSFQRRFHIPLSLALVSTGLRNLYRQGPQAECKQRMSWNALLGVTSPFLLPQRYLIPSPEKPTFYV